MKNTALGAVEGKYKFDPALASTVGVSVETVQFILHDLGFRYEDTTETTEATTEGEEATTTVTRFYHVKKRPPRLDTAKAKTGAKPKFDKNKKPVKGKKPNHNASKPTQERAAPKGIGGGYNAFAELASLQLQKKS